MYRNNELKIKVEKDELLKVLRANRKKHVAAYEKAKKGFRKLLIEELKAKLIDAEANRSVQLRFDNQKPDNNLNDYDDVIGMLELATDTEIELSHVQYKQYVKDQWDWKTGWTTSNSLYLSAAA